MRELLLQRALIRSLYAILGAAKGMVRAWEEYVEDREKDLKRLDRDLKQFSR
jgi:hypothetical protein